MNEKINFFTIITGHHFSISTPSVNIQSISQQQANTNSQLQQHIPLSYELTVLNFNATNRNNHQFNQASILLSGPISSNPGQNNSIGIQPNNMYNLTPTSPPPKLQHKKGVSLQQQITQIAFSSNSQLNAKQSPTMSGNKSEN